MADAVLNGNPPDPVVAVEEDLVGSYGKTDGSFYYRANGKVNVIIKEDIYLLFVDYFANPVMTKIKNELNFSMYISKSYCLLSKECRYIIAFTFINNFQLGTETQLKDIKWLSLQTRTLTEQYNINSHGYSPIAKGPLLCEIERTNISKEASTYKCKDFPLIVTLLHTEKKDSDNYQNKGTIIAALETWETIITFTPV